MACTVHMWCSYRTCTTVPIQLYSMYSTTNSQNVYSAKHLLTSNALPHRTSNQQNVNNISLNTLSKNCVPLKTSMSFLQIIYQQDVYSTLHYTCQQTLKMSGTKSLQNIYWYKISTEHLLVKMSTLQNIYQYKMSTLQNNYWYKMSTLQNI